MQFSVLMSVYGKDNYRYFEKALKSVTIEQTLKPKEVIIVYDGVVSHEIENVVKKIQKMNEEIRYKIIRNHINLGLAKSLNIGINACNCEWIARMDSDDIAVPYRFEKQFQFLNEHSELSVIGGYIAEFKKEIGDTASIREVGCTYQEILQMGKKRTPMNHMTIVYKKEAILNVNGYNENFGKLEDYKLWVDLIANGYKLANIPEILVNARIGNGFLERRSDRKEICDWDRLQDYMLEKKIINFGRLILNKIYIRIFIYMPSYLKKIVYNLALRK